MRRNLPLRPVSEEPAASIAAERHVLGVLMIDSANVERVAAKLTPNSFELPRNASIFRTIVELASRKEPTTPLAVHAELERRGEQIGSSLLLDMVDEARANPAHEADPAYLVGIVLEGAERRRQVGIARRLHEAIARNAPSEELALIIAQAAPKRAPVAANAICSRELDEVLAAPAVEWLVDGLVQEVGVAMLAGQSNTGKSLFAQLLSIAITYGRGSFLGRTIDPALVGGSVVYVACEGATGLPARFRALVAHHEGERRCGRLVIATPKEVGPLLGQQGAPLLRSYLQDRALEMAAAGAPLRLVVVDTFAAAADGDENAVEGTRQALSTLGAIAQELGVAVLALHHERKAASSRKPKDSDPNDVRGSNAIVGAVDQVLQLTEEPGVGLVLTATKSRDGAKGAKVGAALLPVITGGRRRNGDAELSVVVVPRDLQGRQEAAEAREAARIEEQRRAILEAARVAVEPLSGENLVQAAGLAPSRTRHLVAQLVQEGALVAVPLSRTMSRYGTPEVVEAWRQRLAEQDGGTKRTKRDEATATDDTGHNPSNPGSLRPVASSALRVGTKGRSGPLRPTPTGRPDDALRPDDDRDEAGRSGTKGRSERIQEGNA